jgi:hypothetical protein
MNDTRRRQFLQSGSVAAASLLFPGSLPVIFGQQSREKLPVAAVVTAYTPNSHADVIVGKILAGWQQDGGAGPDLKLVSLWTDQVPANDSSRSLAEKHGFRIAKSIDEALTFGTDKLQVAGVLSIGEHGNYPFTPDTNQHMYPRRRFFDEIAATFRRVGQVVPVFNDKHLAYRWEDAKHMFDTARAMRIPFLAGSSVPVAWRVPQLDLPRDCEIEAAVTIGYGGLESYGFHALESHQCLIERRRGGETGLAALQAVTGSEILAAEQAGRWSRELFEAALKTMPPLKRAKDKQDNWIDSPNSAAYLLEHRDGLKSAVIMASGLAAHFATAVKLKGRDQPLATWFKLQENKPFGHFAYLLHAIEHTVRTGKAAYPVERTLLTTGMLDRLMHSLAQAGQRFETPELNVTYQPVDWPYANHPQASFTIPND